MDKKRIAQSFSNAANTYDQHAQLQRDVCNQLLNQFEIQNPKSILDIGCGTGFGIKQLNTKFKAELHGIDLASKMISYANEHAPFAKYQCADAENLPFVENQFDLIISSLALQWLENVDQALSQIARCLKKGGQAWVATLGEQTLFELKQSWQSVDENTHVNAFHNVEMWQKSALNQGLKLEVVEEKRILQYKTVIDLAKDLKGIGAHNVNQKKNTGLTGKSKFKDMQKSYELFRANKTLPATYQIIYLKITAL